jgi:hypothetical protein
VRFVDGRPASVHVGAHGNDQPDTASTYFASKNWVSGGVALQWQGDHPIIYSAEGSHGVWPSEGAHNYKTLASRDRLTDHTAKGTPWETWSNIVFFDEDAYVQKRGTFPMRDSPIWVMLNYYNGRWGDHHAGASACDLYRLSAATVLYFTCDAFGIPSDEFQRNDGPNLPNRKRDENYLF